MASARFTAVSERAAGKKNRAVRAAKSREETPKEGIYSQRLYREVTMSHAQMSSMFLS
jgi:hypothetical protein